jgi:hypothetical protein
MTSVDAMVTMVLAVEVTAPVQPVHVATEAAQRHFDDADDHGSEQEHDHRRARRGPAQEPDPSRLSR